MPHDATAPELNTTHDNAAPLSSGRVGPRVHDLRHTFATWAIQGGASLMWVQRALGHESITTTVDTYGHITPADRDAFAETMSAMFAPRLGP